MQLVIGYGMNKGDIARAVYDMLQMGTVTVVFAGPKGGRKLAVITSREEAKSFLQRLRWTKGGKA